MLKRLGNAPFSQDVTCWYGNKNTHFGRHSAISDTLGHLFMQTWILLGPLAHSQVLLSPQVWQWGLRDTLVLVCAKQWDYYWVHLSKHLPQLLLLYNSSACGSQNSFSRFASLWLHSGKFKHNLLSSGISRPTLNFNDQICPQPTPPHPSSRQLMSWRKGGAGPFLNPLCIFFLLF